MLKNLLNHLQELRKKLPGRLTSDSSYLSNTSENNYNTKDVYSVKRVNLICECYENSQLASRKLCDNERQNCDKNHSFYKHPNVDERDITAPGLQSPKRLRDTTKPCAEARILPHFLNRKLSLPFPEDSQLDSTLLELSSSEFTTFETKESLRENNKDSMQESKLLSSQSEVREDTKTTSTAENKNKILKSDNVLTSKEKIELLPSNKQDLLKSEKTKHSQDEKDSNTFNVFGSQQQFLQQLGKRRLIYSRQLPNTIHQFPETNKLFPPFSSVSNNNNERFVFIKDAMNITSETSNNGKRTQRYNNSIFRSEKSQKNEDEYNKLKPQQEDEYSGVTIKGKPDTLIQSGETVCNYKYKKSTNKSNFLASKKFGQNMKTKLDTQDVYSRKKRATNEQKVQVDEQLKIGLRLNKVQSSIYKQKNGWRKRIQNNENIKQTAICLNRCLKCKVHCQKELSQPNSKCSGFISLESRVSTDSLDSESLSCNDKQHTRLDSSEEHEKFSRENFLFQHGRKVKLCRNSKSQRRSEQFCKTYDEYYKSVLTSTVHLCFDIPQDCDDCRRCLSNRLCHHRYNKRQISFKKKQEHKGHHRLEIQHCPEGSPKDSGREKLNSNNSSNENLRSNSHQQLPYKLSSPIWINQSCSLSQKLWKQNLVDTSREDFYGYLGDYLHCKCTCASNMDYQRELKFLKNNPESYISYVNPDDHQKNVARFGNLTGDDTLMDSAKYSYSGKKDHDLEISSDNIKEHPKQRDGISSEESPLPTGSLGGLVESYPWSVGRKGTLLRKEYFDKRLKRVLAMVVLSVSIILVLGITTGIILAYLRRKQLTAA